MFLRRRSALLARRVAGGAIRLSCAATTCLSRLAAAWLGRPTTTAVGAGARAAIATHTRSGEVLMAGTAAQPGQNNQGQNRERCTFHVWQFLVSSCQMGRER